MRAKPKKRKKLVRIVFEEKKLLNLTNSLSQMLKAALPKLTFGQRDHKKFAKHIISSPKAQNPSDKLS